MTGSGRARPAEAEPVDRPDDVDTGFWLWLAALPLMVIGYVVDLADVPAAGPGRAGLRGVRLSSCRRRVGRA